MRKVRGEEFRNIIDRTGICRVTGTCPNIFHYYYEKNHPDKIIAIKFGDSEPEVDDPRLGTISGGGGYVTDVSRDLLKKIVMEIMLLSSMHKDNAKLRRAIIKLCRKIDTLKDIW